MPRRPSPEKEREYAELAAFLDLWSTHVNKIDPGNPAHPTNVGREILAQYGFSKALEGMRQAINDTLEDLPDLSPESIRELDAILQSGGVVTITELRRRCSSRYRTILKRGALRNETDYHLVKNILDDVDSSIDAAERDHLCTMLLAFEQRA